MSEKDKILIKQYAPHPVFTCDIQCYWTLNYFDPDSLKKFYLISLNAGLNIVLNLSNPVGWGLTISDRLRFLTFF